MSGLAEPAATLIRSQIMEENGSMDLKAKMVLNNLVKFRRCFPKDVAVFRSV